MLAMLPNALTFLRLLIVPVIVFLLNNPTVFYVQLTLGLFVFAAFSDFLDGYLARLLNVQSDLGKLLDPLADKLLVVSVLVMLVALRSDYDGTPWVPAWLVVLVLAREFWVTGLRAVAAKRGVVMAADISGKIKSFLQMVSIVFLLFHHEVAFTIRSIDITCQYVGIQLLVASLIFSYWGAVEYTFAVFRIDTDRA